MNSLCCIPIVIRLIGFGSAEDALSSSKCDKRRAINYAAMDAMQQMGETPVIDPDLGSQYNPGGGQIDVAEFNQNWAKGMTMYYLNHYIESNYMYNCYDYHGYAVNVEPLQDWEGIYFTPIYMGLDRKFNPPPLTPDLLFPEETHVVYWKVNVPMNISIVDIATGEIVENKSIRVENLILAKYPLLESLTTEYETRLNGFNALMTETTAIAMGYTWVRGYLQYYKPGGPKNIVDNEHLSLIVNGALLMDQGFVFNSVDPGSIIEYGIETKRVLEGKKDISMAEFVSSAKTISQVRKWYVDEVLYQVNEQYGGASDKIDDEINSSFGESADGVRDANKNGASLLKSVMCFPIGFTMKAEHVMPNGSHFGKDELAYWGDFLLFSDHHLLVLTHFANYVSGSNIYRTN